MDENPYVEEFLLDVQEAVVQLDRNLVELEKDPSNRNLLGEIFRSVHTVKGSCGFIGFKILESVAHEAENLLTQLRDGSLTLTTPMVDTLIRVLNAFRKILSNIKTSNTEGTEDFAELIQTLLQLQQSPPAPAPGSAVETTAVESAPAPKAKEAEPPPPEARETSPASPSPKAGIADPGPREPAGKTTEDAETGIRVNTEHLDRLTDRVGELVIIRNQILQNVSKHSGKMSMQTVSHQIDRIISELQEKIMRTRMQAIGSIWGKFPRLVRDCAMHYSNKVRLEMKGRETELDRHLLGQLMDPLMHIIRNAIGHGIEKPDQRAQLGKPAEGILLLEAHSENGWALIEVSDDGAGMDPETIASSAMRLGLISDDQRSRLSVGQKLSLAFMEGVRGEEISSTGNARKGMGLTLAKAKIEEIGGTVELQSRAGQGTLLKLKLPLTQAIQPVLLVSVGKNCFAIPQNHLLELVRLTPEMVQRDVDEIRGTPVFRLHGKLLPLVHLSKELGLPANDDDSWNIAVLKAEGPPFGLVVEEIKNTMDIVVKPLAKMLQGLDYFSGSMILGDGSIGLILNIRGLSRNVGLQAADRSLLTDGENTSEESSSKNLEHFLLIGMDSANMVIYLHDVDRLEDIARSNVERSGGQDVVQYRGQIMPLVYLSDLLSNVEPSATKVRDRLKVVVFSKEGETVGLVVDRILDIVAEDLSRYRENGETKLPSRIVVQGHTTDVLDTQRLIWAAKENESLPKRVTG